MLNLPQRHRTLGTKHERGAHPTLGTLLVSYIYIPHLTFSNHSSTINHHVSHSPAAALCLRCMYRPYQPMSIPN